MLGAVAVVKVFSVDIVLRSPPPARVLFPCSFHLILCAKPANYSCFFMKHLPPEAMLRRIINKDPAQSRAVRTWGLEKNEGVIQKGERK